MTSSVVGPWAKDKLDRLGNYLSAYTTILRKQNLAFYYIDAFAGPGAHEVRSALDSGSRSTRQILLDVAQFGRNQEDQREFLAGSPRVALDIEHPFSAYIFIERSPDRIAALEQLRAEYGDSRTILIRK